MMNDETRRRRFIYLVGYRQRDREHEVDPRMTQSMISERIQRSQSPVDVSLALSEDSTITITELNNRNGSTFNANSINATPVMRRRRSQMSGVRQRNYRILDQNESKYILQQQSAAAIEEKKGTLLRRKSSKKLIEPLPMIITPPVLMARTQCCAVCYKEKSTGYSVSSRTQSYPLEAMSSVTTDRSTEEETARLSFVSSSTGYSSARSSLRSSDGGDESNNNSAGNRDSAISNTFSLSSQSSARRSALLTKGSLTHLDRIAIELLDTERTYVEDLNAVIKGYMDFLVEDREKLKVTLDAISSLFGCIERIFAFNKQLYNQLDAADLDCVKMSRCFVESSGKFEDYIEYCTNYHRMMSTLYHLQQQPLVARALQERQLALNHSLQLSAYLLKPVQRILKYHLFLENILKNMPSTTHPEELIQVKRAHEVMTSQAARINDEKKKAEHIERVGQLQSTLQKWKADEIQISNLSAYGDLLLEATFRQAGSKTTRLLFLFEEMLLIVKQRGANYVCKDYIMCSNLMLNEWICPEEPLSFQVLSFDNPRAQYVFMASSMEQKRTWMQELKRMMLDHYSVEIPEKTKQLMLSIDNTRIVPFGRPEFAEVSMKNHKKVPKYLEKRRKSVDAKEESNRRRSLSASRLLGGSKTSISEPIKEEQKCTCHMNGGIYNGANPTTSKSIISHPSLTYQQSHPTQSTDPNYCRPPVCRTQSAATIDLNQVHITEPNSAAVMSSRSRYQQARNRRLPPRHNQESRSTSSRRMGEEEIDRTFDQLYEELVSFGDSTKPTVTSNRSQRLRSEAPQSTVTTITVAATPATATLSIAECANTRLRSKSLTRLDEYEAEPISLKPSIERRYSKVDQLKKRSRKYQVNQEPEAADVLRPSVGRFSLTDHEIIIHGEEPYKRSSGRQRTPLTAQQTAELDDYFPSSNSMNSAPQTCSSSATPSLMSIIRQYENA
ncbi:PH domain-containing protein [Caenorhabditis elegans]|uniref:PH domain-containing protein n=1 Tax=Caenorhabditis elegans TaxID=6239 RepID=G5EER5_CAEEL|nr:PH domain-containing protein [Caenorhabditis elegans]CBL43438.1 PH domain-containing protein [Caenorhabditis elegans]|eukprot:NP_001256490.1 UNC-112-Interacting Guanine nucleotide exchange factor [Caenorhabditis elegans]